MSCQCTDVVNSFITNKTSIDCQCTFIYKFITGNVTYVLVAYVINVVMLSVDILLTLRNMALDKLADRRAAKEKEAQG